RSRDGLMVFGVGLHDIHDRMESMEKIVQRCVYNMQPEMRFDPTNDLMRVIDDRSRRRGVEMTTLITERSYARSPIVADVDLDSLLAPVSTRTMIVDERFFVSEGPPTADGRPTAWVVSHRGLVREALDIWASTMSVARAVPRTREPLTDRDLRVGRLLCRGLSDTSIAASTGLSVRSIARSVQNVAECVGATTRQETICRLYGGTLRPSG
ncbi:MAG: helix-turn-helix transcriptional regulator, partial [Phycicoccus sp.]